MSFNAVNNTTRGSPDTKALHAREQEEKLRTEAAFHDDGDTYDYIISMAFNERSIKLADQIAAAAKANGETVFHGNMLNTGKGASVHEWTQEWETKYVGFVRKCRKGVICLMEHDYTKEAKGVRSSEFKEAAIKGPRTRIVVLVDNPAMLSDDGFPDDPAPKKEYHILSFQHVGLDLNGKKIYEGIQEAAAPAVAGDGEHTGNFQMASSCWPGNAPYTAHVKEVAHHHVHEKQKWMQAGGVLPSEVLTVDLHRTGKASHVGFGKLNAFDTEPRNMKIPDFETWVRTEVYWLDPAAAPVTSPGPKGKTVTQLKTAAKEIKAKQDALIDLFTLNVPTGPKVLREAAKLLEYSSIWHPKDADGEAEADVIRLKVFKAIFPSKFATYFGLAPCLFWQNERRLIAIAFADLVAMQDRLDKSVPTRNGEQKRERKGLGFDRFNVGRTSAEAVFSPAESQFKPGNRKVSAEKGIADLTLHNLEGAADRARAGLASPGGAEAFKARADAELPGVSSVKALAGSGLWE